MSPPSPRTLLLATCMALGPNNLLMPSSHVLVHAFDVELKTGGVGKMLGCSASEPMPLSLSSGRLQWRYDAHTAGLLRVRACVDSTSGHATSAGQQLVTEILTVPSNAIDTTSVTTLEKCIMSLGTCEWCSVRVAQTEEYTVSVRRLSSSSSSPISFSWSVECPTHNKGTRYANEYEKSQRHKDTSESKSDPSVKFHKVFKRDQSVIERSESGRRGLAVPASCRTESEQGRLTFADFRRREWDTSSEQPHNANEPVEIPWRLYMTYFNTSRIPRKVHTALEQHAPAYTVKIFDDRQCMEYLRRWYGPRVARRFECTPNGAHRADLFRYALLYHRGGVYMDVKTVLTRPLREVFTDRRRAYTVLSTIGATVYQGVLATPPRNPALWRMLQAFLASSPDEIEQRYDLVTYQAHRVLTELGVSMTPGAHQTNGQGHDHGGIDWTLLKEECAEAPSSGCMGSGCRRSVNGHACTNDLADRYGYCCEISGQGQGLVFRTRYTDYPW
eukprot:m.175840 g.175840  ORF g.175840 m.175840 type:complete len:501 (+) comp14058_c0_seq1:253-1755(+)